MNSRFRIVKGKGIEIDGRMYDPHDDPYFVAELSFLAGQREALHRQLHETRVSRERLDAIVPMVMADL